MGTRPLSVVHAVGQPVSPGMEAVASFSGSLPGQMPVIFRLHHDKDEDNWWKGRGRKLARWARRQFTGGTAAAPVMA
ncbi:hypothetical protein [Arthrobacter sp. D3-16]